MTKKRSFFLYILAFIVPCIFVATKFYIQNIHPFGGETLIVGDIHYQLIHFFNELSRKISTNSSLFYSMNRGMGGDFYSEVAYYLASPLNIISILFNKNNMYDFVALLFTIKSGLLGLSFFTYIRKHFEKNTTSISDYLIMLLLSYAYSASAYFMSYSILIMWIDGMILLPMVILALEYLIKGQKKYFYPFILALAIFSNYYTAFMICLFLILYFFYYSIFELKIKNKKSLFRIFITFVKYSLLSALITSFIMLPNIIALSNTAKGASGINISSILDCNYSFMSNIYSLTFLSSCDIQNAPKLYCGVIVIFLVAIFSFNSHINITQRIGKLCLLILVLLSMQFTALEFLVNGLHCPNGFVGRNSFIAIFLILVISYEGLTNAHFLSIKKYICLTLLSLAIITLSIYLYDKASFATNTIINIVIIILYSILIFLFSYKSQKKACIAFACIMCIELLNSSFYTGITVDEYNKNINIDMNIDDSSLYRVINLVNNQKNLSSTANYKSLSTVSSVASNNTMSFLSKIGAFSTMNATNTVSFEPVFASILGVKYIYAYSSPNNNLLKEADTTSVFINENALSIAFEAPYMIKDVDFSSSNPFENINEFSNAIINKNVYEPIELKVAKNKIYMPESMLIFLYSKNVLMDSVYHHGNEILSVYPSVTLKPYMYENTYNDNHIYTLSTDANGGYIELDNKENISFVTAYELNIGNYTSLINTLSTNQMNVTKFTDNSIYGTINADSNDLIVTSIPYSKGWCVKVDRKKINTTKTIDNLLSFDITKGNHSISLYYVSPGFYIGIIISVISLILLIIFLYLEKGVKHEIY